MSSQTVSVLIPTLNSARTLGECLHALRNQDYPASSLELIVADAGSTDDTVGIAERFGARVLSNPLRTGEAGKAVALRSARSELVALVDSDNIVAGSDWLTRMVAPFADPTVVATEPVRFVADTDDTLVNRYCALMGVNDPLCLFIGNYDRISALSGKWTELDIPTKSESGYFAFPLDIAPLPTIGANGTVYRRAVIDGLVGNFLMDIDLPVLIGQTRPGARFAKVDVGIRHLYCQNVAQFARKQQRRMRDFFSREARDSERVYPWDDLRNRGVLKFVICTATMLPLFWQALRAYRRTPDSAAFFHPAACMITLAVYGTNYLFSRGKPLPRSDWKQ